MCLQHEFRMDEADTGHIVLACISQDSSSQIKTKGFILFRCDWLCFLRNEVEYIRAVAFCYLVQFIYNKCDLVLFIKM
jgi:hypothetical protein